MSTTTLTIHMLTMMWSLWRAREVKVAPMPRTTRGRDLREQ